MKTKVTKTEVYTTSGGRTFETEDQAMEEEFKQKIIRLCGLREWPEAKKILDNASGLSDLLDEYLEWKDKAR